MLSVHKSLQSRKLTTELIQKRQLSTLGSLLARTQQDIMCVGTYRWDLFQQV